MASLWVLPDHGRSCPGSPHPGGSQPKGQEVPEPTRPTTSRTLRALSHTNPIPQEQSSGSKGTHAQTLCSATTPADTFVRDDFSPSRKDPTCISAVRHGYSFSLFSPAGTQLNSNALQSGIHHSMTIFSFRRLITRSAPAGHDIINSMRDIDIDVWRSRDHEKNMRTSLPDCESVDLCCVWGVEFYGPSHVASLIGALEDLNSGSASMGNPRDDPVSWLRDLRRHRAGGAYMNLGVLTRPGSEIFWPTRKTEVPLPSFAEYAHAHMFHVTASLIAVVACFIVKEKNSKAIDAILQHDRQTVTRPTKRGVSIYDPALQKSEDIEHLRDDLSSAIARWFQEHLPGQFSSGPHGGTLPTGEFLTTQQAVPFPSISEERPSRFSYLRLLGLDFGFDVWKSDSVNGLFFKERSSSLFHSVLAAREREILSAMGEGYAKDRNGRIFYIDEHFRSVILTRALLILLDEHTQNVLRVRDADLSRTDTSKAMVEYLENLTRNVLYGADISAVAAEIPASAEAGFLPFENSSDFFSMDEQFGRERVSYSEHSRMVVLDQAHWLHSLEEAFRAYSTQVGSLLGTKENVRLQRHITWMTVALLVLAVIAVIVTVLSGLQQDRARQFSSK